MKKRTKITIAVILLMIIIAVIFVIKANIRNTNDSGELHTIQLN